MSPWIPSPALPRRSCRLCSGLLILVFTWVKGSNSSLSRLLLCGVSLPVCSIIYLSRWCLSWCGIVVVVVGCLLRGLASWTDHLLGSLSPLPFCKPHVRCFQRISVSGNIFRLSCLFPSSLFNSELSKKFRHGHFTYVAAQACILRALEAEAGGSRIQGQPGLH